MPAGTYVVQTALGRRHVWHHRAAGAGLSHEHVCCHRLSKCGTAPKHRAIRPGWHLRATPHGAASTERWFATAVHTHNCAEHSPGHCPGPALHKPRDRAWSFSLNVVRHCMDSALSTVAKAVTSVNAKGFAAGCPVLCAKHGWAGHVSHRTRGGTGSARSVTVATNHTAPARQPIRSETA